MSTSAAATVSVDEVVHFFKVLADETRLAIVRLLALSDLRAGEVVVRLHTPQNAVSYHLKQLRSLGLLRDRRSSADARDVYYSVDLDRLHALYAAAGDALHPAMQSEGEPGACLSDAEEPLRILFLCTHNSARSQIAEALARRLGGNHVEVYSAGNQPTQLHPLTIEVLHELGVDPAQHTSKAMTQFLDQDFDYVITVCDRARESCPTFPGDPVKIHWSFPDPTQIDDVEEQRWAFRNLRREMETRIRYLLCLPHPLTGRRMQIPLQTEQRAHS